jgi:short subunit dehydrogenase-like uncharacterized protein
VKDGRVTDAREHDLVVHGATGFVGRLVAAYLAQRAPAGVRIALSGRSRERLERVRDDLGRDWPVLEADATDPASMAALAARSRVVATTVGPFLRYGLPLVEACARAGTHYADLTGEVQFIRRAADACDAAARAGGARIVHACGYDSIPSDLAVLLLHERAAADGGGELGRVRHVASVRGGLSGGTLDTIRGQIAAARRDPAARRLAADPFALSPDRAAEPATPQPPSAGRPARDPDGTWTAPFVMAPFNTRVVRRSNALLGWAYGRGLRYGEVMGCGRGVAGAARAVAATAGLGALLAALSVPLLDRVLPAPGSGPGAAARERGWFRSVVDATTADGRRYRARVAGRGDPGYAATAVMFGQTALALALDGERLPDRAGSLTPATALGGVLVERLRAAGHTYDVAVA